MNICRTLINVETQAVPGGKVQRLYSCWSVSDPFAQVHGFPSLQKGCDLRPSYKCYSLYPTRQEPPFVEAEGKRRGAKREECKHILVSFCISFA